MATVRECLVQELHDVWPKVDAMLSVVPAKDYRFCGQYLILSCMTAMMRETAQTRIGQLPSHIGGESMPNFSMRWAMRFMKIAFPEWNHADYTDEQIETAMILLRALMTIFTSTKEIALVGSALIVGFDEDDKKLLDLLHYIADIRSSIDTGVQLALRADDLID